MANYLLPDLSGGRGIEDIQLEEPADAFLPTIDTLADLLPEQRRKKMLAAQFMGICLSLAGDFIMSQDESVMDDHNWI